MKTQARLFPSLNPAPNRRLAGKMSAQNAAASRGRFAQCVLRPAALLAWAAVSVGVAGASDIFWAGGSASYNTPANWIGGVVPVGTNNAINANGSNNVVQINAGDPDWSLTDLSAGGATAASGAIEQNGQTVNVNGWLHIGNGTNSFGMYTLNGGVLNVPTGQLFLGEDPFSTSVLNINGGTINKSGDLIHIADGTWNGAGARTGTVNQTGGTVNSSSEITIGQDSGGTGIYNLGGGTINIHNVLVIGNAGGNGLFVMTNGTINKDGTGNFLVASGDNSVGELDQGGGTINCANQLLVPETGSLCMGTYNLSNTAVLNVHDWLAIGRDSGAGVLNISGNAVITRDNTNDGGANFDVGASGIGILNQNGGAITNLAGQTWIGESSSGTWNLNSGTANLGVIHFAQNGSASGILNLNGGTLIAAELTLGNVNGGSLLNLNGGTIIAAGNSLDFIHGLAEAYISSGGFTIDSQNYTINISQELDDNGGGSLTKQGGGTLTLSGPNTYSGDTIVNAGTLGVFTGSPNTVNYAVADNAALAVTVQSANGQLNANNLTLGSAAGAALNFDLGSFGNPTSAPLNVNGAITANGRIVINLADALPQLGEFPLISLGSGLTGAASFAVGSLPTGVSASIVTNIAANTIDLNITSVNLPVWSGAAGENWDIGATANWINLGTGTPTSYAEGDAVRFDDSATGGTVVNLAATVHPASILFTNNSLAYSLVGPGKISGATALSKQGTASLAIVNTGGNDYTGPTIVAGGVLSVTNLANGGVPSAIGASSASPTNLVIAGGTFSYAGAPVTINRGYELTANGGLDVESNLAFSGLAQSTGGTLFKTGPATLTYAGTGLNVLSIANVSGAYQVQAGAVVLDGSQGTQTNTINGELWVGCTATGPGSLILTNTSLGISSWLAVDRGDGASGYQSAVTLFNSTLTCGNVSLGYNNNVAGYNASPVLSLRNHSTLIDGGAWNLAENAGATATLTVADNSTLIINTSLELGGDNGNSSPTNGSAAVNQLSGTVTSGSNGNYIEIGAGTGAYGCYNLVAGTLTTPVNGNASGIRVGATGTGILNQSGGALTCSRYFAIGTQTGGGAGGVGVATFTGGTASIGGAGFRLIVGDKPNNTSILNVGTEAGGNATVASVSTGSGNWGLQFLGSSGTATLNLDSGILETVGNIYVSSSGAANFNFNGGTLQAGGAGNGTLVSSTAPALNVYKNGAVIDSQGFTTAIQSPLLAAAGNGIYPAGGMLTVSNNGGAGYIGVPLVTVSGGSGSGAMAVANISTGGVVTNLAITCPGQNYVAGDVLNFNFSGGGATMAAAPYSYTLQAGDLASNAGGVTKIGSGTVYLNGANTYPGNTLVAAGTLAGSGTISGPVTVASGAALSAGAGLIGTLTINNSLTLSSGSATRLKLSSANNDQIIGVTGVTFGGTLIVTNTGAAPLVIGSVYKLFNFAGSGTGNFSSVIVLPSGAGTFNPATGELTIVAGGNSFTVNSATVSGGNLILTGAGGAAGSSYTLLSTTNLATPMAAWITNATGTLTGTGAFSNAIPVNSTEPARFYRARMP